MNENQHPLTETAAVEMWDASPCPEGYEFRGMLTVEQDATVYAMRAAFDAGREHEREHARPADVIEITDEMWDASSDHERTQACPAEATSQVERVEALVQAWEAAASMVEARDGDTETIRDMLQDLRDALAVDAHPETPDPRHDPRHALAVDAHPETPDPRHDPRPWQDCTRADIREGDLVETLVRDHVHVGVAHRQDENGNWWTEGEWALTYGDRWPLRRIPAHTTEKETPMPENTTPAEPLARTLLAVPAGHGAPHHDAKEIKFDDFVLQIDKDGFIRGGRVHHQDEEGDWVTEDHMLITWASRRADRPDALTVWLAPTPPAVEVEWEPQFGDVITDVKIDTPRGPAKRDRLVWDGAAWCQNAEGIYDHEILAFTLPDGTRARRDGEREDGKPRFVKVREGEK